MSSVTNTLAVALPFNVTFAFAFVTFGYAATFLMLRLWAYPFDKTTRKSEAPRWAMWLHRGLGYAFVGCYLVMMWRMVSRLFSYQVELPARTVAHVLLGFTVGFLLLIKISILRFFRHFEEWMPYLGVGILLCTTLLLVLSLPPAVREHALAHGAPGGDPFGPASLERVARLLPDADLPASTDLKKLATEDELRAGRTVLLEQCSTCHDLKTVLDKPRPPATWANVVERMAAKPSLFGSLSERDQARVTAYLIAITPDLQRSLKQKRSDDAALAEDPRDGMQSNGPPDDGQSDEPGDRAPPEDASTSVDAGVASTAGAARDAGAAETAARDAGMPDAAGSGAVTGTGVQAGVAVPTGAAVTAPRPAIEPAQAKAVFMRKCSGCHEISDIDASPPTTTGETRTLVKRMQANGLRASRREVELITWWLNTHYVRHAT